MSAFSSNEPWPELVVIDSTREGHIAGLDPHYDEPSSTVSWHEGGRRRIVDVVGYPELDGDTFEFTDTRGYKYTFLPMTVELYNKVVSPHTVGRKTYASLDELVRTFRNEW